MTDYTELKRLAEHHHSLGHAYTVATPSAVLALIAENERLQSAAKSLERIGYRDCGGQLWKPPIGQKPNFDLIDQLRAEVAGLKTGYEAYERVSAGLKAEVEGLRKYGEEFAVLAERRREEVEALRKERDARHPFKPFHEPAIGFTGCVICGVYTDHGGLPCPKTRALANALAMENQRITPVEPLRVPHPLDAALGQGEQS